MNINKEKKKKIIIIVVFVVIIIVVVDFSYLILHVLHQEDSGKPIKGKE